MAIAHDDRYGSASQRAEHLRRVDVRREKQRARGAGWSTGVLRARCNGR